MEFDLKEIAVTIIIGAYLIFGVELLLYIFFRRSGYIHLLQLLEGRKLSANLLIVLAVVSCFAFGIFIEAVSGKMVDEDNFLQKYAIGIIPGSRTDDEIKRTVLLGKEELEPLSLEVARRDLLRLYGGEYGGELQALILCEKHLRDAAQDKKSSVAKNFYYHAKNIAYGAENYYDELRKIQTRIDFSRSYLAVSSILFLIIVPLFVSSEVIRRRRLHTLKGKLIKNDDQHGDMKRLIRKRIRNRINRETRGLRIRVAFICAFLFVTFLVGVYAYNVEEKNFDKRAYGYFSSMKADTATEAKCVK